MLCAVCCVLCAVCCVLCAVCCVLCAVCCLLCAVRACLLFRLWLVAPGPLQSAGDSDFISVIYTVVAFFLRFWRSLICLMVFAHSRVPQS